MAPIQQKFTVIPDLPPSRCNGSDIPPGPPSRPPMTSKQAKRLYKAANKGPKLSKAEQRRQELFEQDRIRKEFEKEKNQARAKASRDKRREKEEKEKAAKRKKGLPLVGVHPSQDTLARFIRPQPKLEPKPKDEPAPPWVPRQDDDSDFTLLAESDAEPPSKRRKTTFPEPGPEAQGKREPGFVSSSRPANRQVTNGPAPHLPRENKIGRPSKRQKSSSPPRKEEAQRTKDQSLARYPASAEQQSSSTPAQQEQVPRRLEPTRANPSPPKSPEQHAALPQPTSQGQGKIGEPTDYDADAAEILDILAQQIADESFSTDDFLHTDGSGIQSRSEAPVSEPTIPPRAKSPRSGHIQPNSANESPRPGSPNTHAQTGTTPRQTLRSQASSEKGFLDKNRALTKKPIGGEVLARTGAGAQPDTASRASFRDRPVPKPLDDQSKPPQAVENLSHSVANPSKLTRSSPRASVSSKPNSRSPLREVSVNHVPQISTGSERGFAIKEPSEHTEPVSKTVQPVFRKPDLPWSASKTSREPQTPGMGPPPGPPRFKTPTYQTSGLSGSRPKFLSKAPTPSENRTYTAKSPGNSSHTMEMPAPSSTQLFLSGLEDFFPSPSQEIKEIFDDASCTHRLGPAKKKTQPAPSHAMPPPKTNISRTSPVTSRKLGRKPTQRNSLRIAQSPVIAAVPACAPAAPKITANQSNQDDWFPPFSTQDFFFSSQDIREVEKDTSSAINSQLVPAKAVVKPSQTASSSFGDSISQPPALPVDHEQSLTMGGLTRLTFHKPETTVLVAPDCRDSQDPWLNLSSQQSKSSLPETPTAARCGSKVNSFNSTFQPRTAQQLGHMAPGSGYTPSKPHVDGNASSGRVDKDGSPAPNQPSLSSSRPPSPQKSPEALRPSPKPFFTSSGTKELTLLAIEKSKRTAREDEFARRRQEEDETARQRFAQRRREMEEAKREEEMRLMKEEETRLAREEASRLVLLERQDQQEHVTRPSPRGLPTGDNQEGSELEDDELDQLLLESVLNGGSMPGGPAQNKSSPPSIFSSRKPRGNAGALRSRSEGSFEKMMALAHKKVSRRSEDQATRSAAPVESATRHQAPLPASQETDYGDAEWDECDLDDFL